MMNSRLIVAAIITKNGKYLLGRKPKDKPPYPNTWHLLGGGVNLGEENLEDAIRREVREEAGIELGELVRVWFDDDQEPNKHGEMTQYVFMVFRAEVRSGEVHANDDIQELQWFTQEELKNLALPRTSIKLFRHLGLL
jgi:8-oxo-dGTP diphosphatase